MIVDIRKPLDGGNVAVHSLTPERVILAIESDNAAPYKQWFNFEIYSDCQRSFVLEVISDDSSFGGWDGAQPVVQYPDGVWRRHPSIVNNGRLQLVLDLVEGQTRVAYFQPYSYRDHQQYVDSLKVYNHVDVSTIGRSAEGRCIDLVEVRTGNQPHKTIWVTARQHPGETMGSWWVEGFITEAVRYQSRSHQGIRILVVPMLNPDGVAHGNIRTNAKGIDLNRSWQPSPCLNAPEVASVLLRMRLQPPDLFVDAHGVEDMRHCFLQPPEGSYGTSERVISQFHQLETTVSRFNKDLQQTFRFPFSGESSIASNFVTEEFLCLGVTLEMPFQDTTHSPQPGVGWTPQRSFELGSAVFKGCAEYLEPADTAVWT